MSNDAGVGERRNRREALLLIKAGALSKALSVVKPNTEKSNRYTVRKYLCGARVEVRSKSKRPSESYVRLIATNGHVLSAVFLGECVNQSGDVYATISNDGIAAIAASLKNFQEKETVELNVSNFEEFIELKPGVYVWTSREEVYLSARGSGVIIPTLPIEEGARSHFPDWERLIPETPRAESMAHIRSKCVKNALNAFGEILEVFKLKNSKVIFCTNGNNVLLICDDIAFPVGLVNSDVKFEFGINGQYLKDAVNAVNCRGRFNVAFNGDDSPILFQKPDDPSLKYVVMPMRI